MSWQVPLTDLRVLEEDVESVLDCLRSGWLTMGPRTARFEEAFAEWLGAPHAVSVSSGTAALHLTLASLGVGPGDEVLVPDLTFVATAAAARYVGAIPVFCDVKSASEPLIDPDQVAARITPRTRAVVAVHFFGYPAPVEPLRALCDDHGLALVEDAAQGIGAIVGASGEKAGTVGHISTFSFFSKNQLTVGEGGMVATTDEALARRVRLLRSHAMTSGTWDRHRGHAATYDVVDVGFNFRLDEARAALGLSRLPRLDADIEARRDRVRRYRKALLGVEGLDLLFEDESVARSSHFAFPVLLRDRSARDGLRAGLRERGIQTTWYPAVTQLSAYRQAEAFPNSEEAAVRHCALPLSGSLTDAEQDLVIEGVREVLASPPRL